MKFNILLEKRPAKFINDLPPKHREQIKKYIVGLKEDPRPHDSETLSGYEPYRRSSCGEYRIIYRIDNNSVCIILVGKRNGGEVYRKLKKLLPQ